MRKNEFFSSPFASASNSMTYPGKQYSTNPWSEKAENDKRLKYNRICRARAPFGGRHAPRANAEKPCFLLSEQGSLSPKTGKISPNNWGLTSRNRDINRPCPGRPHGPRPPTVRRRRDLCVTRYRGSRGRMRFGQHRMLQGQRSNRSRPVSSRSGSSPFHGAGRLGAISGHSDGLPRRVRAALPLLRGFFVCSGPSDFAPLPRSVVFVGQTHVA